MSTGFRTFNGVGAVEIDTDLITWNLVDFFEVAANTTAFRTYPDLIGLEFGALQMAIEIPKVADYTYEKTISLGVVSGGIPYVNVYGGNQRGYILVAAR